MPIQHGTITGDAVHVPYAGTFANAAARTGATGLDSTQHGKLFRQLDDNSLWMLVNTSPLTWKSISPDRVASAGYADSAGYANNAGTLNGKAEGSLSVNYADGANYANSAGSAPANGGTAHAVTTVPNVVGSGKLPEGGTWRCFYLRTDYPGIKVENLSGGSYFTNHSTGSGDMRHEYTPIVGIRIA